MKSVAIFLALVFLTGFQAAVLNEEPPPSIPEPDQNFLEQMKEHAGKLSTQVANSINERVEALKQHTSNLMTYAKKSNMPKYANRKFSGIVKDLQQVTLTVWTQSKETMNDQYKKVEGMLEEMKKHPTVEALREDMVKPLVEKLVSVMNWMGDQSANSLCNVVQKKFSQMIPALH